MDPEIGEMDLEIGEVDDEIGEMELKIEAMDPETGEMDLVIGQLDLEIGEVYTDQELKTYLRADLVKETLHLRPRSLGSSSCSGPTGQWPY